MSEDNTKSVKRARRITWQIGPLAAVLAGIVILGGVSEGHPITTNGSTVSTLVNSSVSPREPVLVNDDSTHMATGAVPSTLGAMAGPLPPKHISPAATFYPPGCASSPCPMGITDYGIAPGGKDYSYKTTAVESFADISVLSVGSSTTSCIDFSASWCMDFQSNWVDTGVMVHNNAYDYWIQNIAQVAYDSKCSSPCVSKAYSVNWWDNIWNMSYPGCVKSTGLGCINLGDLAGNQSKACRSTSTLPARYYVCYGPSIYGLSLPMTIWTYTSTGTIPFYTTYLPDVSMYGGIIKNNSYVYGAYYDTVYFAGGSNGAGSPAFKVQNATSPYGLPLDGEWDITADDGARTIAMSQISVMMETYYETAKGFESIKHAWSSGYDTGESVSSVDIWAFSGYRHTGSAAIGSDDSQTNLW